jgi:hypothetical protein
MSDGREAGRRWRHQMMNQLGIILGFSDLLLQRLDQSDPHWADLNEIREATHGAMRLMQQLEAGAAGGDNQP